MAEIKVKRSAVPGKVPLVSDLQLGEIALNTYDGIAYIKKDVGGTQSVIALGGGGIGTVTSVSGTGTVSGLTLSGTVTGSGELTLGGALSLSSLQVTTALGFTPYDATNPNGFITSSASITGSASTLSTGRTISLTGDVTYTSDSFNGSANVSGIATLANSGVTAGIYGSSTQVPVITVDAKGRVTSVITQSISGALTFTGDVTGSGSTGTSTTLTLNNNGVVAGSYSSGVLSGLVVLGSTITVDAKGRVSSVTTSSWTPAQSAFTDTTNASNISSGTLAVANGGTGATTAATACTNLGATTLGANLFTLTNVAAISFPRINADNTVSSLDAATFRTAIGAGTGDVSLAGTQTLTNKTIQNSTLEAYQEKVQVVGTVSTTTYNIDLSLANIFDITLGANVTFTFTNPPASNFSKPTTIILRQGSAGNRLATFTGARYTDGIVPVLSTGINQIDVLTFFTLNGGTFWFGTFAMANVS